MSSWVDEKKQTYFAVLVQLLVQCMKKYPPMAVQVSGCSGRLVGKALNYMKKRGLVACGRRI